MDGNLESEIDKNGDLLLSTMAAKPGSIRVISIIDLELARALDTVNLPRVKLDSFFPIPCFKGPLQPASTQRPFQDSPFHQYRVSRAFLRDPATGENNKDDFQAA